MRVRLSSILCEIELRSSRLDDQTPPRQGSLVFHSVEDAQIYLRRFSDSDSVRNLRAMLAYGGHSSVDRLSAEQVWHHVAMMLFQRTLSVSDNNARAKPETRRAAGTVVVEDMPAPPENIGVLRTAWKSPSETTAAVPEEASPFADFDIALQVDVLKRAAESGVPFCEECMKRAAARAA